MRRIAATLLVVLLAAGASGAARAQYVMDLGSLIAALRIGDFAGVVEGVHDANTVYVARVSGLAGIRLSGRTLDRTIAARQGVLRHLRAAIGQAPEAMKALERHGHRLDQVIFVTTTKDRTAMLYVDDR